MKYTVAPEFPAKLMALAHPDQQIVGMFVRNVAKATGREEVLSGGSYFRTELLAQDIYLASSASTRIYFTFGSDKDEEVVILLDVTSEQGRPWSRDLFAVRNPRTQQTYNPTYNHSINPIYNHSINPIYNHSINPIYNHSINPIYNHSINPIYNHSINPIYNHSINPIYNHSINPIYNRSISPSSNPAFGGPYLYDKNLQKVAYLVRANDNVDLLFDMSSNQCGQFVRANEEVRIKYDRNNKWSGTLVSANDEVSLSYDSSGTWDGLVV